jgi:acetyltransferase-like isoleucine patch superfamily enzyme
MWFSKKLEKYLTQKRNEMLQKWDRVLPSNELLFDRWEKAKLLKFGLNSSVYDSAVIMGEIKVGSNVWIGPFCVLEGINGKLTIGDNCMISSGVQIYTHDSVKHALSGGKITHEKGDVSIGKNTYIGSQSIINKGVTIGNYCVIGANSFVNKDIPDNSIAFGTPARVVGKIIIEEENVKLEYYNKK